MIFVSFLIFASRPLLYRYVCAPSRSSFAFRLLR